MGIINRLQIPERILFKCSSVKCFKWLATVMSLISLWTVILGAQATSALFLLKKMHKFCSKRTCCPHYPVMVQPPPKMEQFKRRLHLSLDGQKLRIWEMMAQLPTFMENSTCQLQCPSVQAPIQTMISALFDSKSFYIDEDMKLVNETINFL